MNINKDKILLTLKETIGSRKFWKRVLIQTGPMWSLLVIIILLSLNTDRFLTSNNLINVTRQVVITVVLGLGMTFVIIGGGIDLSVGSVMALCGAISARYMFSTNSVLLSIGIALAVGCFIGLLQGLLVTKGEVAPFAVTLGGLAIFRGLTLIYTKGVPISGLPSNYRYLGAGTVGSIPVPVLAAAILFILCYILLNKTRFGRYTYAMGSNEHATRLTGVNVGYYRTLTYVIAGFCAAFAGIILTGRINSAHPQAGAGYELMAIAAVVIGGTSLSGGEGKIYGTILGAVIIGVIQNGLNLLHVSAFWQDVSVGAVIILAVLIDRMRMKLSLNN